MRIGSHARSQGAKVVAVIALAAVYAGVLILSAWSATDFGEAGREVIKWVELLVLLLVVALLVT